MTILLNNLRRIFGKPLNIILMVVVPIVLNIFFISVTNMENVYVVGVIDCDDSRLTQIITDKLKENADIVYFEDDEMRINSALLNGEIHLAVRFAENYEQDMIAGKAPQLENYTIMEDEDYEPIRLMLSSYNGAFQDFGKIFKDDAEKFNQAVDKYLDGDLSAEYKTLGYSEQEKVSRAVSSLGYLAMGMMFLMSFATTLLLEDKVTRVYSRLLTTPVSRASYLIQHLISYVIVAALQVVLIINILPSVVDISFGSGQTLFEVIVVTLIFATSCIAIGLTISRFSKNNVVAGAFVGLVNLPVLMLGGCMWPRELMPEAVQKIGDFMPTTWFLSAAETVLYGEGLGSAKMELIYLGALAVVLLTISFTVKTDDKC
ncbi:MAG: ABC transporter permease [Ruminococcaceae bacterium]|nr:ABC transporter permease [Oscillospiraceae bacterium]